MSELERTDVAVDDGTKMTLHVAKPTSGGGRKPGMLVFQEAFGVNHHIRAVARRYADEGYVAVAPELFHRTAPGFEGSYTDFESVRPQVGALTVDGQLADIKAAHRALASMDEVDASRIACVGFCMGGRVSYLAASSVKLRAAISYYGSVAGPLLERAKDVAAPMLFFWGGQDKHITPDVRRPLADALRDAGKLFVDVEFSFADHGFNCDERASYDPTAARHSWALVKDFLAVHL
jgi:carboxymethylenebutenolidase